MKSVLLLIGEFLFANIGGMLLLGGLLDAPSQERIRVMLAALPFVAIAVGLNRWRSRVRKARRRLFGSPELPRYQVGPAKSLPREIWSAFVGVPCVIWMLFKIDVVFVPTFSVWAGTLLVGLFSFLTIRYAVYPRAILDGLAEEYSAGMSGEFHLFVIPYTLFWSNVLLFYGLISSLGTSAFTNLNAEPQLREVIPYVFGVFLNTVAFDLPDLLGYKPSPIEPIRPSIVVGPLLLYKVCTSIGFVLLLLASYKAVVKKEFKYFVAPE